MHYNIVRNVIKFFLGFVKPIYNGPHSHILALNTQKTSFFTEEISLSSTIGVFEMYFLSSIVEI